MALASAAFMCLMSRVRREDPHHARGLGSQAGIGIRNWSDTAAIMSDRSRAPIPLLTGGCGVLEPHRASASSLYSI